MEPITPAARPLYESPMMLAPFLLNEGSNPVNLDLRPGWCGAVEFVPLNVHAESIRYTHSTPVDSLGAVY